ncbi:hypothetical protein KAI87_17300 [Myxococcota bacterium]|nr:hypothetical protein [Myxococcota bacterium]
MKRALLNTILVFAVLGTWACSDNKSASSGSGECSTNADCLGGQACIESSCETLCQSDTDCGDANICVNDLCTEGQRQNSPEILTLNGDGATLRVNSTETGLAASNRIREKLIVSGSYLQGAVATLIASDSTEYTLDIETSSDTQIMLTLPLTLQSGNYTLKVANAIGADEESIWLLQGEPGVDGNDGAPGPQMTDAELLAAIKNEDGTGSGLDADSVDGLSSSDFAAHDHSHLQIGQSRDNPATGCIQARDEWMSESGTLWVDLPSDDPDAGIVQVYCEQRLEGGGWGLLYNSVIKPGTMNFWDIPYADRLSRRGHAEITRNFYNGAFYLASLQFMDVVEDLHGKEVVAFVAEIEGSGQFDSSTMLFFNPTLITGNQGFMNTISGGWSSADYDGDTSATNCAEVYNNVTQHYTSCWGYNLGSDADSSGGDTTDQSVGPHLSTSYTDTFGLYSDGSSYTRLNRISRFARF